LKLFLTINRGLDIGHEHACMSVGLVPLTFKF